MTELKPCPFCGGRAEIYMDAVAADMGHEYIWWVTCDYCAACSGSSATVEKAVEAWNRRSDDENG